MRSAYHFFLRHAGYSYRPDRETPAQGRRRSARELAHAEREGKRFGLTFAWEWETDIDDSWMSPAERAHTHEWLRCVCYGPEGAVLASLGNIVDPSPEYQRVVEAELADEALAGVAHA